jgi:hypothetical protein
LDDDGEGMVEPDDICAICYERADSDIDCPGPRHRYFRPGYEEEERRKKEQMENKARNKEEDLDYVGAIKIWDSIGNRSEARRIRQKMRDEGYVKVDQTVVHGDYVDDRDTIVKDSVINRSNVGAGGDDKFTRLEKLTEMKEKGLIDDAEFKQMKKEILGK